MILCEGNFPDRYSWTRPTTSFWHCTHAVSNGDVAVAVWSAEVCWESLAIRSPRPKYRKEPYRSMSHGSTSMISLASKHLFLRRVDTA